MTTARFDREALSRLRTLAVPFFVSELRFKACGLLVLLALFSLSISGLDVMMSYVGRDFMTALSLKESEQFMYHLYRYLGAFAIATPVVVFYRYTEERLGLLWRRWLSHMILGEYFTGTAYYRLSWYGGIDNPDQRIEEDVRSFTSSSLSFLLIIFNSVIKLVSFTWVLWSISTSLVVGVVLYASVGSIVTYFVGRRLIDLNFVQLKREADYRYKLVNIRDNSESIAFYKGEHSELTRTRQRLKSALSNLLSIINWNRNLNFFVTGYNYVVSILPTIIVAPLYLNGEIQFGEVTQAAFAFGHVLGALSIIVHNFGSLSSYAAVVNRLGSFSEIIQAAHRETSDGGDRITIKDGQPLQFENVTIYTPTRDQRLTTDLSFTLEGRSLLITGPSGSGKSSILRVIGGLWTAGQGTVIRPAPQNTLLIPQRPYMVLGTLRDQLLYSTRRHGLLDSELRDVLRRVKLEDMLTRVGGFDSVMDWHTILSTGEQQRLAFARLLIAEPTFVCLDEATTALDAASESDMYQLLMERERTYISVGYRTNLEQFHDVLLNLHLDGTWKLERLRS